MTLDKQTLFYIGIIASVVIAYFFVGQVALTGLLAMLFNTKGLKKEIEAKKNEADFHEEQVDVYLAKRAKEVEAAQSSHEQALKAADITQPHTPAPPGFKKKSIKSK